MNCIQREPSSRSRGKLSRQGGDGASWDIGISNPYVEERSLNMNLFEEVCGKLPEDRSAMLAVIDRYLGLPAAIAPGLSCEV
ncbi:MAG: hypothetical protein ABSF52_16900 [Syntrophobacteraceae bacterium]|jgi:hypothetical protein